jgi:hypothetical protein
MKKILSMLTFIGLMGVGCASSNQPASAPNLLTPEDENRLTSEVMMGAQSCDWLEQKIDVSAKPESERVALSEPMITFRAPYSKEWRVDGKGVAAVSISGTMAHFGPYQTVEGCGLGRAYTLQWKPKVAIESLLKEGDVLDRQQPKQVKVGPWDGVVYEWSGLCDMTALAFNMDDKTYTLYAACATGEKDLMDIGSTFEVAK